MQPQQDAHFYALVFYIVFLVVGAYFTLNLFISVIVDNFRMLKKELELKGKSGGAILTDAERGYIETVQRLTRVKPRRIGDVPNTRISQLCRNLTTQRRFDIAMICVILTNVLVLALTVYHPPAALVKFQTIANYIFTAIYTVEAILKLVGFGKSYFQSYWNMFDFFIVVTSWMQIILQSFNLNVSFAAGAIRALRVIRVIRILRVVHQFQGIRKLFVTFLFSLPSLVNVGAILFLMVYVYAVIGMNLFGDVILHSNFELLQNVNFQTFPKAFLLMFRLSTGSGWDVILQALSLPPPFCDPNYNGLPGGNCGNSISAYIFLVTYVFVTSQIIVNMFIAVILENFGEAQALEESLFTDEDVELFYDHWALYDREATQFIHFNKLLSFLTTLPGALGMPKATSQSIFGLKVPLYDGDLVHCIDLIHALMDYHRHQHASGKENIHIREATVKKVLDRSFNRAFPLRSKLSARGTIQERHAQVQAIMLIQSHVRRYLARKHRDRQQHLYRSGSVCAMDHLEFIPLKIRQEKRKEGGPVSAPVHNSEFTQLQTESTL